MDISKRILKLSPSKLFNYLADNFFKELDDTTTKEIEWLGWDPDSLIVYLFKKGILIEDNIALDKVMALLSFLHRRDIGTSDAKAFEKIVHAFNNDPVIVDVIQEPTLAAVNYAVKEMRILNSILNKVTNLESTNPDLEFTGEVPGYVASVAYSDGYPILNNNLIFAKDILNFLNSNKWRNKESNGLISKIKDVVNYLDNNVITTKGIDAILDEIDQMPADTNNLLFNGQPLNKIMRNIVTKYIGLSLYDPCILE